MTDTTLPARRWRPALVEEVRGAASQLRRAERPTVVKEVALQLVVALLGVAELLGGPTPAAFAAFLPLTAAALLARRRWPALALVAVAPPVGLDAPGAALAAVVVAFTLGRCEVGDRRRLLALAVATALCLAVAPLVPTEDTLPFKLLDAALGAVLLVLPMLAGVLVGRRRFATDLLRERNDHLERARVLEARQARLEEQARITREMHDVLGHRLSLLSVHAGALELAADAESPRLSAQARTVRTTAVAALDELRAVLAATPGHPRGPDPGPGPGPATGAEPGGRAALEDLAEASRRAGAQVRVLWRAEGPPPAPGVGRAVDRVVREGLTNAGKHAPGAAVTIAVERAGGRVRACVRNGPPRAGGGGEAARAGVGPGSGTRLGLLGLAERAALQGGRAAWGPGDDGGFELVVEMPADPPTARAPAPDEEAVGAAAGVPVRQLAGEVPPPVRDSDVLAGGRVAALVGIVGVLFLPLTLALVLALVLLLVL